MKRGIRVSINQQIFWHHMTCANVSQNQLAHELGVSSSYLSQIVNGRRFPSAKLRKKLLKYFEPLNFNDLFSLISEDNPTYPKVGKPI